MNVRMPFLIKNGTLFRFIDMINSYDCQCNED